ncbi:MAG: enoyl-CoA hydratase/isomerase family protein [Mycobacterium sp.]
MTEFADTLTTLTLTDHGHCIHAELARPEKKNAIDATMAGELHTVCEWLEARPATLVISGSGGVFAAGADLAEMRERRALQALSGINSFLFRRIAQLPMPVIAAVDGWALGGGAELAYAADFRIGTPEARFGNPETGLGIAAAAGGSWRLAALIGEPVAKQVLLAGRILDAKESLRVGLITEIVPAHELVDSALRLSKQIAKGAPTAVRLTKALMQMPDSAHPVADNIAQAVLFETADKYDRMTAFLEKTRDRTS